MYIPEAQKAGLVELQFTVLPEDEWLIGISDLGYFQGIGFSLPLAFDEQFNAVYEDYIIRSSSRDSMFRSESEDILIPSGKSILVPSDGDLISIDEVPTHSDSSEFDGPALESSIDEEEQFQIEFHSDQTLYAFLPGIFYCSKHNKTVDGVLIEVNHKEILEQTVPSFKPEFVTTLDIHSALAIDSDGSVREVGYDMKTVGKFATGLISTESLEFLQDESIREPLSFNDAAFSEENKISKKLLKLLSPEELKQAYVSGAIVTGQLMTLLHDINSYGISPRGRIYIKNSKYPDGQVIEVEYQSLNCILDLSLDAGISIPSDLEIEHDISKLSFAKLIGCSREVDIETTILDTYYYLQGVIGLSPTKDEVLELLVGGSSFE
ncbi:MAG: hypothetical protein ACFFF4_10600 [Candidatus Thorarchaeota archaeon]